jgi:hypothetical protein
MGQSKSKDVLVTEFEQKVAGCLVSAAKDAVKGKRKNDNRLTDCLHQAMEQRARLMESQRQNVVERKGWFPATRTKYREVNGKDSDESEDENEGDDVNESENLIPSKTVSASHDGANPPHNLHVSLAHSKSSILPPRFR